MKKNNKNLIITISIIVAVFILAAIFYPKLSASQTQQSYQPTINADLNDANVKAPTVSVSANSKTPDPKTTVTPDPPTNDEQVDSTMIPDFPITRLDGSEGTIYEDLIEGMPTVINLFASWCPPCQAEMPDFVQAAKTYKGKVNFMFFDSFDGERETKEKLLAFIDKMDFAEDFNVYLDPGYLGYIFNSNSIPVTIMLDKDGNVSHGYQGMVANETLIADIEKLLQ
ncbi:MAG: TlpA disulfide reductase family protein [Sphaerochaetaceae bacterium]